MSVRSAFERLSGHLDGLCRRDELLARHTTFRIGGPAALFIECDSIADLTLTTVTLEEEGVDWTVLGKGSNVLAADSGYGGAIIVLGRDFKRHALEGGRLSAGAGVSLAALVQAAFSKALTGLEFAVGVPGTLGGALVMNAGSREEWIGSVVESVTVLVPGQGMRLLRHDDIAWGYRMTDLAKHGIAVEASLSLQEGDEWKIRATMEAALKRRRRTQPLGLPNAGSVFANPDCDSAGGLIERCGLKGTARGGAQISDVHANFIVNTGGATARDVLELMKLARDTVREAHGIELRPEIRFLGAFDEA